MTRTYKPQKTATLGLRLKPEIKLELEKRAAWENKSISKMAEECIEETLRRKDPVK